jgi:hypothetical protein
MHSLRFMRNRDLDGNRLTEVSVELFEGLTNLRQL